MKYTCNLSFLIDRTFPVYLVCIFKIMRCFTHAGKSFLFEEKIENVAILYPPPLSTPPHCTHLNWRYSVDVEVEGMI